MKDDKVKLAEREHGKWLRENEPVRQWGWGTPAGRLRAVRRAKLIINAAGLLPGKRVMEIGCGVGMFTEAFAETGASILAVDISPELLDLARGRGLPSDTVEFHEGPFEECESQGPFDAIIGSSVLHHLDSDLALRRIFEKLKPNGVVCFAEPNMLNPHVWSILHFRKFFPHVSPDETAFIRWKIGHKLQKIGFIDVDVIPFDWLHPTVPEKLIKLVKSLERIFECIPGLREFSGSLLIKANKPL